MPRGKKKKTVHPALKFVNSPFSKQLSETPFIHSSDNFPAVKTSDVDQAVEWVSRSNKLINMRNVLCPFLPYLELNYIISLLQIKPDFRILQRPEMCNETKPVLALMENCKPVSLSIFINRRQFFNCMCITKVESITNLKYSFQTSSVKVVYHGKQV